MVTCTCAATHAAIMAAIDDMWRRGVDTDDACSELRRRFGHNFDLWQSGYLSAFHQEHHDEEHQE